MACHRRLRLNCNLSIPAPDTSNIDNPNENTSDPTAAPATPEILEALASLVVPPPAPWVRRGAKRGAGHGRTEEQVG